MRRKKTRPQITIEICINHATADEREHIKYAIVEALAAVKPEWTTFNTVRITELGWLH